MPESWSGGPEEEGPLVAEFDLPRIRFICWEQAIREPIVYSRPVTLEPPFVPIMQYMTLPDAPAPRAFRRPGSVGLIERLYEKIAERNEARSRARGSPGLATVNVPDRTYYEGDRPLAELQLEIPDGYHTDPETAEQFLLSLVPCEHPVSFEMLGCNGQVCSQFACREDDRTHVAQQLRTYFPDVPIAERKRVFEKSWFAGVRVGWDVMDFGLSCEFMLPLATLGALGRNPQVTLPLATFEDSGRDPLIGIRATLATLEEGEVGILQVLFEKTYAPWKESILASAPDEEALSFLENARELVEGAQEKAASPLFAATIRVACQSSTRGRAREISDALRSSLEHYSQPPCNVLTRLSIKEYVSQDLETDLLARRTHRSGQLLNSKELVTLVHLPLGALPHPIQQAPIPQPVAVPPVASKPVKKPKRPTVRRKESAASKLLADEAKASVSPPAAQQSKHGYTVRLQVKALGEEEKELRQQAVSQILANAIKRLGLESAGANE